MSTNKTLLQCFEWYLPDDGKFWNHVKKSAGSFEKMGISGVWLPPAYKGFDGTHDVGYGVYDMYDLGEFDQKGTVRTKYGTRRQYLECIHTLQKNHIEVIVDTVLNHRMGADGYEIVNVKEDNPYNRYESEEGVKRLRVGTKFTFPGRHGKYSSFTYNHRCFDGIDTATNGAKGIFRFADKKWDGNVDDENGNYDYLMGCDLDFASEEVRQECERWGEWYLNTTGADGMRLDAVKHIDAKFLQEFLSVMRNSAPERNDMFAVGEYWSGEVRKLIHYLEICDYCMSLFDVSLHYKFFTASNNFGNFDMSSLWQDTLVWERPGNAITFVDNHDTQPGQALCSYVNGWFKQLAYALILYHDKGIPCVFYGDLYGIPHDKVEPVSQLREMIKVREVYAYGQEQMYFDDCNVVGFTRSGDEEHENSGMAVIMSDNVGGVKKMCVGRQHQGEIFVDLLNHKPDEVVIDENGEGKFSCEGGSVSIYLKKAAVAFINDCFLSLD